MRGRRRFPASGRVNRLPERRSGEPSGSASLPNDRFVYIAHERSVKPGGGTQMKIRLLGWAGVEVEEQGERIVIDPLEDATAVFSWIGDSAAAMPRPAVVAPRAGALAGLVTHLHRDHADAGA